CEMRGPTERRQAVKRPRHADTRCRQRGYKSEDLELLERFGTATGDGIYLRHQDVESAIRGYKRAIAALERLDGTFVVLAGNSVVEAQRARRWKERAALRSPQIAGQRRSSRSTLNFYEEVLR